MSTQKNNIQYVKSDDNINKNNTRGEDFFFGTPSRICV